MYFFSLQIQIESLSSLLFNQRSFSAAIFSMTTLMLTGANGQWFTDNLPIKIKESSLSGYLCSEEFGTAILWLRCCSAVCFNVEGSHEIRAMNHLLKYHRLGILLSESTWLGVFFLFALTSKVITSISKDLYPFQLFKSESGYFPVLVKARSLIKVHEFIFHYNIWVGWLKYF